MIITRSPLRISLGGGGTDLPSYYEEHTGFLIAAAIDKYVYINLQQTFDNSLLLRYSKMERPETLEQIAHPIIRESLRLVDLPDLHLEIASMADIPAGTGLGSSGSFTTALLKALHAYNNHTIRPQDLAEQACKIEIDILKEPIGKQDQYIAAFGGLTCFEFFPGGKVTAWPLKISKETLYSLEDNLVLFFTGFSRKASTLLQDQDSKSKNKDPEMINNLHYVKELGLRTQKILESGDLVQFGAIMDEHWQHKRKRSKGMSNPEIDQWYDLALKNGAIGGKLIGAGGGGFLMFYCHDKEKLRSTMTKVGLREVRFRFDFHGTQTMVHS